MQNRQADALILGGGLAGCAAAIELATSGRSVQLFERAAFPQHKVCGEFLSHEALGALEGLGIDLPALGAVPLHAVRFAARGKASAVELPFRAASLTRRALDAALLDRARAAGAEVHAGVGVQNLCRDAHRWTAELSDGTRADASNVFLATGKHDLRGHARPAGRQHDLLGFKMYVRLSPDQARALAGHVEILLFRGGYAGLQPVEAGLANLCLVVRRQRFLALGATWPLLLAAIQRDCPHLAERLQLAEPHLARPLAIAPIPYGMVQHATEDGLWRLGDQAAVIPSFTGDGMSIALCTGRLAAQSFLRGISAPDFQRSLADQIAAQVSLATWVSRALVRPALQTPLASVAGLHPQAMSLLARATRLPRAVQQAFA